MCCFFFIYIYIYRYIGRYRYIYIYISSQAIFDWTYHFDCLPFCEPAEGNFTHICSLKLLPVYYWLLTPFWGRSGPLDLLLAPVTLTGMAVITLIRHKAIQQKDVPLWSLCSKATQQSNNRDCLQDTDAFHFVTFFWVWWGLLLYILFLLA